MSDLQRRSQTNKQFLAKCRKLHKQQKRTNQALNLPNKRGDLSRIQEQEARRIGCYNRGVVMQRLPEQSRNPAPPAVHFMQVVNSCFDQFQSIQAITLELAQFPGTDYGQLLVSGYETEQVTRFNSPRLVHKELKKNTVDWEAVKAEIERAWTNEASEIFSQVNVTYRFTREFVKDWLQLAQTKRVFKLGSGKIIFTHRPGEVICTIQKTAGDQLVAASATLQHNPVAKYICKKMPLHETLTIPLYNQVEVAYLLEVLFAAGMNQGCKDQLINKSRELPDVGMPEIAGYGAYLGLMTEFENLIGILKPLRLSRRQVRPGCISFVIVPLADRNAEPMCQGNFFDAWAFLDELNR